MQAPPSSIGQDIRFSTWEGGFDSRRGRPETRRITHRHYFVTSVHSVVKKSFGKGRMKQGYVQVYTGDGKGKTTAALGLALRAVGAGLKVYIGQFIKKGCYSEIRALKRRFPDIVVRQYGRGGFIRGKPRPEAIRCARRGLAALRRAVTGNRYDLVVADEANCAVSCGVLKIDDLLELVDVKPAGIELVFTGRDAHPRLVRRADLVTDMKAVKHYFQRKVPARKGIEH